MSAFGKLHLNLSQGAKILDNTFNGVYVVDEKNIVRYWNSAAEDITGFTRSEVLGNPFPDLRSKSRKEGKDQNGDEAYLWHRNGRRIAVHIRLISISDAKGESLGTAFIFQERTTEEIASEKIIELEKLTFLDPLTRVLNRRGIQQSLQMRIEELWRYDWPFGVLFVDIDHFKDVNDQYGHTIGDRMLRLISKTLLGSLRPFDVLGRWGGEEFLGIVINVGEDELARVADRARALVQESMLPLADGLARTTISVGATTAVKGESAMEIVSRADRLMYDSKLSGRNRVTIQPGPKG